MQSIQQGRQLAWAEHLHDGGYPDAGLTGSASEGELSLTVGDDIDQVTVPASAADDAHGQDFGLRGVKTGETAGALVDRRTTGHVIILLLLLCPRNHLLMTTGARAALR